MVVEITQDKIQQMLAELHVSEDQINECCENQAQRYAYWSAESSRAEYNYENQKTALKVLESEITREVVTASESKISQWQVESLIHSDPRWKQAKEELAYVQYVSQLLENVRLAFQNRREMIVTLAANLRGEMKGHIRLSSPTEQDILPPRSGNFQDLASSYLSGT